MKYFTFLTTLVYVALTAPTGWAQCKDDTWTADPELKASAEQQTAVYENAIQNKQYRQAAIAINWLAENAPRSTSEIYTDGIAVYDLLGAKERNPVRKKTYLDSIMVLYDLKAKNCGDKADVFNSKAMYFYKYNLKLKPAETLQLFDSLLKTNKNLVSDAALIAFLETVKVNQKKFRKLTDEEIISYYDRAMRIADAKLRSAVRNGTSTEKVLRVRDDLNAILLSMVVIDCDFLKNNLGPRFREHPNDLSLARKILSFMLQSQCTDDPLWLEAGERLYRSDEEKDFTLAKTLGLRYFSMDKFSKADKYFEDGLSMAPTDRDKIEMLLYLGRIRAMKDKPEARKLFLQVLELDKGNKEVYERIGDLYFNSEDECSSGDNEVENALVFMLAEKYYQRSGNAKKVTMAREKFPTKATLQEKGYVNGQEQVVGCWIDEATTITAKD